MRMRAYVIILLFSMPLSIFALYGGLELTSNLFNTPDNYNDLIFKAGHADEYYNNLFGMYWNIEGNMPVINNEMANVYLYTMINRFNEIGSDASIDVGTALSSYLYFLSYSENLSIAGDIYSDFRKQSGRFIYKLSLDVLGETFPYIYNARREYGELKGRIIFNHRTGISLHMAAEAGAQYYDRENVKAYRYSINPLISKSINDNIGVSLRFAYARVFSDSMPYFLDDSFINSYYYNNIEAGIGLKVMIPEKGTLSFDISAGRRDFINTYSAIDTFEFSDRNDTDIRCRVTFLTIGENRTKWEYNYEKGISNISNFTFDSHTLSVTVGL